MKILTFQTAESIIVENQIFNNFKYNHENTVEIFLKIFFYLNSLYRNITKLIVNFLFFWFKNVFLNFKITALYQNSKKQFFNYNLKISIKKGLSLNFELKLIMYGHIFIINFY